MSFISSELIFPKIRITFRVFQLAGSYGKAITGRIPADLLRKKKIQMEINYKLEKTKDSQSIFLHWKVEENFFSPHDVVHSFQSFQRQFRCVQIDRFTIQSHIVRIVSENFQKAWTWFEHSVQKILSESEKFF